LGKRHNSEESKSFLKKKTAKERFDEVESRRASGLGDKEDVSALLSELNVYQFELEMQNDELKVSYDALDAERERFANLYDFAPVSYFIVDHLGIIEDVNQTGVELLRLPKVKLQQKRFQSFVFSKDLDSFYGFLHKMHESAGKVSTEVRLNLQNKETIYVRIEGAGITSLIPSNVKYYLTVIDTTESRKAQEALKEANERLEMILKASSTGIWSIEFGNKNIKFDENSLRILGLKSWEFDGSLKAFFASIHPDDRAKVRYSYLHSLNNSTEMDLEFRIITREGSIREVSTKGQIISISEEKKSFAGIIMDITERKRLAKEAESFKQEQQRAVLTATLDAQEQERFKISRALHDSVCQILYGIRLNIQSLKVYKDNKEDFKNVNSLLDQAIKETREISYELTPSVLKEFGFTAGIKEMANRLSTQEFSVKATIKKSLDQIDQTIQLYAFRIIQELVNNCMKHAHATIAEIIVCGENDSITIMVTDNGKGFTVELGEALRKGSGLRGIKNQIFLIKGELEVSSNAKGTSVTVTFKKSVQLN